MGRLLDRVAGRVREPLPKGEGVGIEKGSGLSEENSPTPSLSIVADNEQEGKWLPEKFCAYVRIPYIFILAGCTPILIYIALSALGSLAETNDPWYLAQALVFGAISYVSARELVDELGSFGEEIA